MAEVFCNQCGHANPAGANFCSSCGAALTARREDSTAVHAQVEEVRREEDDATISLETLSPGEAMLVVMRGPGSGSRFAIDRDVISAGRHPDSDIFLDDVTVSRRHAELRRSADGFLVRDAGSLNGTYLNRERIEEAPITNGDELQIGRFKLVFLGPATSSGS